ncbi:MAG: type I DNA topoisomerase [Thermoguttaceae bacterium]|nr:type I DNA topoisomerase [Thermoguttaceae bacterium]MDW8038965.1 type I DNA topoisomerase [Thermoguttaceae bacterium]
MAKKAGTPGTSLVIVESPTKARTLSKFLGPGFTIEASIGHIRDLPESAKEVPKQYRQEEWRHLGVNVHDNFRPIYVIPRQKAKQVRRLKEMLKKAQQLYLATDEDREGEAISWHLCEVLQPKVPVHRLVFHEITQEAVLEALKHPRQIDQALVRAQETRRIVDRLYGYELSPLLWRKIGPRLSAGRVQSVAIRLIVERERQRMAFVPATYWDLLGLFAKQTGETLQAPLVAVEGRRLPTSRDFDPNTGQLKDPGLLLLDESAARALAERLRQGTAVVRSVEEKPYISRPYPPFTTSTLQQEANRKFGFTARRTMQAAQNLYESGYITYMRTDSTSLAAVAVEAARQEIMALFGAEYLAPEVRVYPTRVKNAQEAHEAIRPAGHPFEHPDKLRGQLGPDEEKLYELIWRRTLACQMADARGRTVTISIQLEDALFEVSGRIIDFPGYLRAYIEEPDEPQEAGPEEKRLPSIAVGETLRVESLEPKSHSTQPPPRYSEATLTRELERRGIGRPSTYATIIDTILARDYVFKRGSALVPTWTAFAVVQLLEQHFPELVDYDFTAEMEDELDAISRGELEHLDYLRRFYFGGHHPGLKPQIEQKAAEIDPRDVGRIYIGQAPGPDNGPIYVRVGRYGPFLEHGNRRASVPEKMAPDELTVAVAMQLLEQSQNGGQLLGTCPQTGKPVYLKTGRFGPYIQRGTDEDPSVQKTSLLRSMKPGEVTLELALQLLNLPRQLGLHPDTGQPVIVQSGRFGPFVKCGDQTRSLPEHLSPLQITLQEALELLAQPKSSRRQTPLSKEPLKVFDVSPVTGQPVVLMVGRYGPYVTDGQTNASLPRDMSPEELTFQQALELLAHRAAQPKRRRFARKSHSASTSESASQTDTPTPPTQTQ